MRPNVDTFPVYIRIDELYIHSILQYITMHKRVFNVIYCLMIYLGCLDNSIFLTGLMKNKLKSVGVLTAYYYGLTSYYHWKAFNSMRSVLY
jgi:hypothetical protein